MDSADAYVLVSAAERACAIPCRHVIEVMRSLPIETIADMPPFLVGLSIIRGAATPVVDLAALLGAQRSGSSGTARFVSLRLGDRTAALLVDSLLGVRKLDGKTLQAIPPLLRDFAAEVSRAIGTLDERLLFVLDTGRLLPDPIWNALRLGEVHA
ncbi:MAG TPA: chemotaxis protein CheW [Polyangiaceae bacterium]